MVSKSPGFNAGPGLFDDDDAKTFASLSLDEWITKFGRMYGKRHDKHTTEYMISRLVEEVAELVNPMESQNPDEIGPSLADVFSWICSIAYKLNIDLSELAWQKYGGKDAPRPTWSGGSPATLASFSQPETLTEWQGFISKLYQSENSRLTPMNALVAMMKDVGDLAMLNRKRAAQESVTSKLAAILAWTLTISQLLRLDLANLVNEKYDDRCPSCHQKICDTDVCHPLSNMFVSFGSTVTDEEKYAVLDAAAKFGYKTLVNISPIVQSTKDLSTSLDLVDRSDAACIVLSSPAEISPKTLKLESGGNLDYKQFFEIMACYSILSKGNVWVFGKSGDRASDYFGSYLSESFDSEKIAIMRYVDAGNLRAEFEGCLDILRDKKEKLLGR